MSCAIHYHPMALQAEALCHIREARRLCEQLAELAHVDGICAAEAIEHLDDAENMLRPEVGQGVSNG